MILRVVSLCFFVLCTEPEVEEEHHSQTFLHGSTIYQSEGGCISLNEMACYEFPEKHPGSVMKKKETGIICQSTISCCYDMCFSCFSL